MTGLRKRVAVGFLSIVCLLFFSGVVSLFELSSLSRDTDDILKANQRNVELGRQMLDAVHSQNVALIHLSVFGDASYEALCRASMELLENTLSVARAEAVEKSYLDSLAYATTELRLVTDRFLEQTVYGQSSQPGFSLPPTIPGMEGQSGVAPKPVDSASVHGIKWYESRYEGLYNRLTSAIKAYMTSTQGSLAPRAELVKKNAYRAVTPVLISLLVMIATVLMLYYFMSIYCVNPIVELNKALGNYLSFKIPLSVKAECKDEVLELKEKVETLITISKQNKV